MTAREVEICGRVNFIRKEIAKWSQPDLAAALGITQNQLAGVEYKRAPLRLNMAKFLIERFDINQRWLALGSLPAQPSFPVTIQYSFGIKGNHLFSRYFDGYLNGETSRIESAAIEMIGEADFRAGKFDDAVFANFPPPGATPEQAAAFFTGKAICQRINWLPPGLQLNYIKALIKIHEAFYAKHAKEISSLDPPALRKFLGAGVDVSKRDLTEAETSINLAEVKAQLPSLLVRLNRATKESGKMSALADFLGKASGQKVPLASVSRWLSGKREPGGEITLLLLQWVERQERQK